MQKELIEGGGQLARGQSMITEENAQKMMDDLVRLCDNIERYGLVDYQYGVWEEQIAASKCTVPLVLGGLVNGMLTVDPHQSLRSA